MFTETYIKSCYRPDRPPIWLLATSVTLVVEGFLRQMEVSADMQMLAARKGRLAGQYKVEQGV